MRVAAIDCGTNSVRLLVAEPRPGGGLVEIDRRLHLTRLGQGVDATGEFAPEALERTFAAISDFAGEIRESGVDRVRFVATSAARDAGNRDAFFAGVTQRLGIPAEIISGDEEARLSYTGALSAVRAEPPVLVMDIGGGSTELVLGRAAERYDHGVSLDIGSVRLRERFLHDDPPTQNEVSEAEEYVGGLLDGAGIDFGQVNTWVGVGGTATSLSAVHQGLATYDRSLVHGSVLPADAVRALAARLLSMPVADVRALPTMQPKRADVICGGALICAAVGDRVGIDLTVSEADILDGIALQLLG